jgi:hypothetical protein
MKILWFKVNKVITNIALYEINTLTLITMILWTFAQHESAVIAWYTLLFPYFNHWFSAATAVFVIVSLIDLFWLYFLFYFYKKLFHQLIKWYRMRVWIDRLRHKSWFQKIQHHFEETPKSEAELLHVQPHDSVFRKFIKRSEHLGIVIIAMIPSPGLKEIAILMALTPKYRRSGFWLIYTGGVIKTIGTLLVYGGLYNTFQQLFLQIVS